MIKQEKYFYTISFSALILIPLIVYPFGLRASMGFLTGIASGILIISLIELSVRKLLTSAKKKYHLLAFPSRLILLFLLTFLLSLYQEEVSALTFVLGFAIIVFVMLFTHLAEE